VSKRNSRRAAQSWDKPPTVEEGTLLTYRDPRSGTTLFESVGAPFSDVGSWWLRVRNALTSTKHIIQACRLRVVTDEMDALTRLQKT
jgi:hypothetical protein